jgi:hypothetical protein
MGLVVLRCSKIDNYRLPLRSEFKALCVSVYVKIRACILIYVGSPGFKNNCSYWKSPCIIEC